MRHARRTRWGLAFVACFALLVAACSGDEDQDGAIREIEPAEEEAEPEPEPDVEPESEEPDEPEPEETEPEPEPEPDQSEGEGITRAGVFVPADAYEINEDLDLDEEQQRNLLEFVRDAFLYTTEAAVTSEWDADRLSEYLTGAELEGTVDGLERYRDNGQRQVSEGNVLESLRIAQAGSGEIIVHQCVSLTDAAGLIDAETGEYAFRNEESRWSLAARLALVPVGDDLVDYRITEITGVSEDVCTRS